MTSKKTKYPEFTGMKELVWEALNQYGRSIDQIKTDENKNHKPNKKYLKLKDNPIWHSKSEIDKFVARGLGLNLEDYEYDSGNALYKQVANEIIALRHKGILQDWNKVRSGTKG